MAIKLPAPRTKRPQGAWPQSDRARWHAELHRRAEEAERRDRAAFLKYKGA
ncbi:hypothetical protein MASR2M16_03660 [Thauera terpenica]